jgi:CRISPR/Cas system CMR-associated protein Cmr5 small subunit
MPPIRLRDQRWALHAYDVVAKVPPSDQKSYKIAVSDLGANILRSGLSAALARLRRLDVGGQLVLEHLALAGVVECERGSELPVHVNRLTVDHYMLATRDFLQVATWLKRAAQAFFSEAEPCATP